MNHLRETRDADGNTKDRYDHVTFHIDAEMQITDLTLIDFTQGSAPYGNEINVLFEIQEGTSIDQENGTNIHSGFFNASTGNTDILGGSVSLGGGFTGGPGKDYSILFYVNLDGSPLFYKLESSVLEYEQQPEPEPEPETEP